MSFQKELATAREYGISPVVLVEQILPVAKGTRKVSMTNDYFFYRPPTGPKVRRSIREYAERHGVDLIMLPSSDSPRLYFFRKEDRRGVLAAGEEIRRRQKDRRFQYQIVEMEGDLLGYPACCATAYVNDKKQHQLQDGKRMQRQLNNGNTVRFLNSSLEVERDILPAFFTLGFYPCKPDCEHAIEIGNRILSDMQGEEFEAYSRALLNNTILASLNIHSHVHQGPEEAAEIYRRLRENEPVIKGLPIRLV